jgi:hypothetical protein
MNRIFLTILILSPSTVLACFDPNAYVRSEFNSTIALSVTFLLLIFAYTLRFFSNKKRLWVPILFTSLYMYYPATQRIHGLYQNGDCGYVYLEAIYWAVLGAVIITIYELWMYFRRR